MTTRELVERLTDTVVGRRREIDLVVAALAADRHIAVAAAESLDELVILAPEGDSVEAAELAQQVGARWTTVDGPSSIVAALGRVLDR